MFGYLTQAVQVQDFIGCDFDTALAIVKAADEYLPPADNVQRTPNAVWVFVPGSDAEQEFLDDLRAVGGRARAQDVSVYRVYADVEPIDTLRPPR